jgi:putative pyoverdin transport system ATP-binding/permease protein
MRVAQFWRFVREHAGSRFRTIVLAGIASGLALGVTIAVMGRAVDDLVVEGRVSGYLVVLFAACVANYYYQLRLASGAATRAALQGVSDLQLRVADALRHARYREFQQLDRGHVYSILAGSKDIVIESGRHLATFISGAAALACAMTYAAFISLPGMLMVLVLLAGCALLFLRWERRELSLLETVGLREKAFLAGVQDVVDGFTELKLNRAKREELFASQIRPLARENAKARVELEAVHTTGLAFFAAYAFLPMGAIVFVLPWLWAVSPEQVLKLLAATFFSLTPMMALVSFISLSAKACASLSALEGFGASLERLRDAAPGATAPPPGFERIAIPEGAFAYDAGNGNGFCLRIQGFDLRRGELLMLTGGNGSGKTTLLRILAGLYPLTSGALLLDGTPVDGVGAEAYRGLLSVIFTDFHLFRTLWGLEQPDPERVRALLAAMDLADKLDFAGRTFSTVDLSSGQRKRLALLSALLEDRPLLLFDEVAAGFDVRYREHFYRTLLPELKAQGRTIVAVSHDDRYFDVADRILTMQEGALIAEGGRPGRG